MKLNGEGAGIVASAGEVVGALVVYVSTNEVFDGMKGAPYSEDDIANPINAYGRSKLDGEQRVCASSSNWCVVRTSWLYGTGRDSFPEKVIKAARERGSIRGVTDEIASPTFTEDLAAAIARLLERRETGTFHLTNEGSCSRKEWAEEVLRLARVRVPVEPVTQELYGAGYRKPDISVLGNRRAAALGIELRPWREALAAHLEASKALEEARP
jgi:dTDP-4-dehydrorhamnose reductase